MRFYAAPPGMGYYADPPADPGYYAAPVNGYGYYAQAPGGYGYYAAPANGYGYYANLPDQPELYGNFEPGRDPYGPVGYVAGEYPMGSYGDPYAMGYYGRPMGGYGYYGQPMGYYADTPDMDGYGGYGQMGYYADPPGDPRYEQMADASPEVDGYGAYGQGYSGYVREIDPAFNAGCPMPTNVHGFGEPNMQNMPNMFEGYVKPSTVNPMCGQFTPQPGQEAAAPDTFKPLW